MVEHQLVSVDYVLFIRYIVHSISIKMYICLSRLTIVSREAKKKQAVRDGTSELFTGSTALKLVNALNKLPLKLLLSYQRLTI